jgi:formylglycine-generating enzyme required for sulfatase activity
MGALRAAQWQYDNQLPPAVSDDDAAQAEWIETHAAQLVLGYRVSWGYRGERGEITQADFARAVQDHLNNRQIDGLDQQDAFGKLVMAGMGTGSKGFIMELCTYLMGGPKALKEIAADLLRPVAAKAVAAEQERDRDIQECGF